MPDPPLTVSEMGEEDRERKLDERFRALFQEYQHQLFGFFRRRGWSREDALDLTQKTLFRVWKGLGDYRETGPVGAWIFSIARNVHYSEKRKRHTLKREGTEVPLDELAPAEQPEMAGADPVEEIVQEERKQELRRALETLSPQRRRCLEMYVYHGHRLEEIAAALMITTGGVKAHLFQARQHLKKLLGSYFSDAGF